MRYTQYPFDVPQEKIVRVITNTDAKNEADDQFAIAQALLSPKMEHVGLIAAHFGTRRTAQSMEESYQELETVLDTMGFASQGLLYRGAAQALPDAVTPVDSEGARLIIREAMAAGARPRVVR